MNANLLRGFRLIIERRSIKRMKAYFVSVGLQSGCRPIILGECIGLFCEFMSIKQRQTYFGNVVQLSGCSPGRSMK